MRLIKNILRNILAPLGVRWVKNEDGVTAIEFSLLIWPYILLTLGIIEISLMYASASMLESATSSAARQLRTGQIQEASNDPATQEAAFRAAICDHAIILMDCNEIQIEVTQLAGFADYANNGAQFDADGNLVEAFTPGGSSQENLVRTAYRYEMMTPIVGPLLSDATGSRLFMSTIVMQNEPYDFDGAG